MPLLPCGTESHVGEVTESVVLGISELSPASAGKSGQESELIPASFY